MLYIVLPAYDEEENIRPLVEEIGANLAELLPQVQSEVVIVNDGSSDDTAGQVKSLQARLPTPNLKITLIDHPQNRGLAEALKTGLLYCCDSAGPRDIILTMDSDNSHTPGLIPQMARTLREGYDVVIASRYEPKARVLGLSRKRLLLSFVASGLFRVLFPIRGVRDYTCGFRAYRASVLQEVMRENPRFISETGFSVMVDVLLKLRLRQPSLLFTEVPLLLRYDKKLGASKMNIRKTVRETLSLICRRLAGRP